MIIKSYKIFERGDGVEDDDGTTNNKRLEVDSLGKLTLKPIPKKEPGLNRDYVMGVPSGEVIFIEDLNDLKKLIDREMVFYTHSFRGQILNCYCFPDKDVRFVKQYLDKLKNEKPGYDKHKVICEIFRNEVSKFLHKKYVIAYIPDLNGVDYYYCIIPDLDVNKALYKIKMPRLLDVARFLKVSHPDSVFTYADRFNREGVQYYGLPD